MDEKQKENYEKARQKLIQESNKAYGRGDFNTSHQIDRSLREAEKIRKENEQKRSGQ